LGIVVGIVGGFLLEGARFFSVCVFSCLFKIIFVVLEMVHVERCGN